jgi:hypothetical protein
MAEIEKRVNKKNDKKKQSKANQSIQFRSCEQNNYIEGKSETLCSSILK